MRSYGNELALLAAGAAFYGAVWQKNKSKVAGIARSNEYGQQVSASALKYFSPSEFGTWFPLMNPDLLVKLDQLREAWGEPIIISPAVGALGRVMSSSAESQHNVIKWGSVNAADIMPQTIFNGERVSLSQSQLLFFYNLCVDVGFTGVGVYPDWLPFAGFHVDVRADRVAGSPATWAGINTDSGQKYIGVQGVFA